MKAQPHPIAQFNFASRNTLRTPDDYCFNGRYLLACAAHRISPAHWHDANVRQDRKIREYMQRLDISSVIDEQDFVRAKREDPRTCQQRIEVVAKGKTFKEKSLHPKGGWYSEEFRNSDEELVEKFINNVSKTLPLNKAEEAAQSILELEDLENAAVLMETVAP